MAANTTPIFPATPYAVSGSLAGVSACNTRAPIPTASLAGQNIFILVPTSTNGIRIDQIRVKACSQSISAPSGNQLVGIWVHDGTNAYLYDELTVTATTPSATAASFVVEKSYSNLVLPATWSLYMSTTVATTAATTALEVQAFGGSY